MGGCPGKTKNTDIEEHHKSQYNFLSICGKGGFGKVWKVELKKSKQLYALKVMSKAKILAKKSVLSIMNQKNLLIKTEHEFLVNMIASFQDRENLYMMMDLLTGGDLRHHINKKIKFNQYQIKFIIWCIIEALEYLHEMNIIHRDIKPQNIIFQNNGYCRLTDLGVARQWKLQNSMQTSGTPGYMAPQVMCRQNHSFCVDYYAVGIIAYELVMGKRPYIGKSRKEIRDDILSRQANIPENYKGCSADAIDFINKMLQRKARNRLGYNGIGEIKQHPWLHKTQQQKLLFSRMQLPAPFIPNESKQNHAKHFQETVPDEIQRQNMLLLKMKSTQKMFEDYDYSKLIAIPNQQKYKEKSTAITSDNTITLLNPSLEGIRTNPIYGL